MAGADGDMSDVRRVSVVGSSGAGTSTFGIGLARRLGVPFIELDAVHHLADRTRSTPGSSVAGCGDRIE